MLSADIREFINSPITSFIVAVVFGARGLFYFYQYAVIVAKDTYGMYIYSILSMLVGIVFLGVWLYQLFA